MAAYFLDTSALVKYYVAEVGQGWVKSLCDQPHHNLIFIAQVTAVELVAALCRKVRDKPPGLTSLERDQQIAFFRQDAQAKFSEVPVTGGIIARAGDLCFTHPLRAYDAVQLACALQVREDVQAAGLAVPIFVSADQALLTFAQHEGLRTDNPNEHP